MNHPQFSLLTRLSLFFQGQGFRTFRRIFLAILALAVVFGVAFYFNSRDRKESSKDDAHVADTKLDSFERVFEEGNAAEVVSFLENRNKVRSLTLPVRIEHFQNRIQLAERLSQISQAAEHRQIAAVTTIEARLSLLMIYQTNNGFDTADESKALEDLLVSLSDSQQPKIRKKAAIADLFVKMEKLRTGQVEDTEITETINRVAQMDLEDHVVASELTRVLDHHNSLEVEIDQFLKEVTEVYAESSNPKVQDVVAEIETAFFRRQYRLLPLSEAERKFVQTTIQEQTVKAEQAMESISSKPIMTGQDYGALLTALTILSQVASPEAYNELLTQAKHLVDGASNAADINTGGLKSLQNMVKAIGQPFPTIPLIASDGQQLALANEETKPTFLFFITSGDASKPINRLNSFSVRFAKMLDDDYIGFNVVYIADEKLESEWNEFDRWAKKYPKAKLLHVRADDNVKFFETISIPWSPCWMLVDAERKLVEFNPLYPVLRSRVHLYIQ